MCDFSARSNSQPTKLGKFHLLAHDGTLAVRFKVMIVAEALEPASQHAILKMMRPVVRGDAASVL